MDDRARMAGSVSQCDACPAHSCGLTHFLFQAGVLKKDSVYINRLARGHPLALKIAASATHEHSGFNLKEAGVQESFQDLTRAYLADIKDADVRRALEASSVVRRVTRPILNAMLRNVAS